MEFAEKLKELRKKKGMSQSDLAEAVGVSLRTIRGWEKEGRFPKQHDIYAKLAEALDCDVAYLMTEDAAFITEASEQFGARGTIQAMNLLDQTKALFAGGELSEEDQLAFINELKDMYVDAKLRAQKKFTPKQYQ